MSTRLEKQVRKDLLKHKMDCVVISVMCLSMPNTEMENDGMYETDFFKNTVSSSSSYMALQLFYRVLAFTTNSFHLPLSWARVFQFGTFNFCISFLTSSTQHVFGLPIGFLEMGFQEYIAFTILVPCILSM